MALANADLQGVWIEVFQRAVLQLGTGLGVEVGGVGGVSGVSHFR